MRWQKLFFSIWHAGTNLCSTSSSTSIWCPNKDVFTWEMAARVPNLWLELAHLSVRSGPWNENQKKYNSWEISTHTSFVHWGRTFELTKQLQQKRNDWIFIFYTRNIVNIFGVLIYRLVATYTFNHLYMRRKFNFSTHFIENLHCYLHLNHDNHGSPIGGKSPVTAGSCVQNCRGAGTRHQGNNCLCIGASVSFCYPFAIHQGLTTSTGWKERAPQWDGTGGDRLRIRTSVFNA